MILHHRMPNVVNVLSYSERLLHADSTFLIANITPSSFSLINYCVYCRSAWCFPAFRLHLEFMLNHDITSSLVKSFHTNTEYAIFATTAL
jgi:hypothetical protein